MRWLDGITYLMDMSRSKLRELVASAKINAEKFLRLINLSTHLFFLLMGIAAAAAKSLKSCPTLCDPIDGSPLGSSVPGILQARILEWVAISFSNISTILMEVKNGILCQLEMQESQELCYEL